MLTHLALAPPGALNLKLISAGCLGAASVLATGLTVLRVVNQAGPDTTVSFAAGKTGSDGLELTRLSFVDERYAIQMGKAASGSAPVKPKSAQEIASLMAAAAEPQTFDGSTSALPVASIARDGDYTKDFTSPTRGYVPADGSAAVTTVRSPPIAFAIERGSDGLARAPLPLEIDIASSRNSRVMIGRVPTGVFFTAGQPVGTGIWQMRTGEFVGAEIVIDRNAPNAFELTLMLLDTNGTVVNGTDLAFTVEGPAPLLPVVPEVEGPIETVAVVPTIRIEATASQNYAKLPRSSPAARPVAAGPSPGSRKAGEVAAKAPASERTQALSPPTQSAAQPGVVAGSGAPTAVPPPADKPAFTWESLLPKVTPGVPPTDLTLRP